jgi:hypothetical protein
MSPPVEAPEVAAAAVTAQLETQEWNMQEIERIQEEQARRHPVTIFCIRVCPSVECRA